MKSTSVPSFDLRVGSMDLRSLLTLERRAFFCLKMASRLSGWSAEVVVVMVEAVVKGERGGGGWYW